MHKPSVAELRPVVHPAGVKDRRSGEHWAGRLYMREISLRCDRYLVNTRITPNQLTYVMTLCGVLAAPALLVPGIWGPSSGW
ncbi:transferase [Streptomyces chrestomyceticus JCM 4735]|uniref:Transferase n=1 Tax=Streptomyces chrestomyceticus JCM 4735 TaxID=1306181 RepID=A0A7U9KRH0_9ACTN|nr:transferase [Streptomyces chrestomyceticus JCM 4735]